MTGEHTEGLPPGSPPRSETLPLQNHALNRHLPPYRWETPCYCGDFVRVRFTRTAVLSASSSFALHVCVFNLRACQLPTSNPCLSQEASFPNDIDYFVGISAAKEALQIRSRPSPAADHPLCNLALSFRPPNTLLVENEVPTRQPKWLFANLQRSFGGRTASLQPEARCSGDQPGSVHEKFRVWARQTAQGPRPPSYQDGKNGFLFQQRPNSHERA
jgi:hypothetical protein